MGWLLWLAGALVLTVIETLTAELTFLMIAAGAVGGAVAAALGAPVFVQVVVFAVVSVLMVFAVRPWARRRLAATTPEMRTNADALVGRSATALTAVDDHGGRVRLAGGEWSARLAPGAGDRLAAGAKVTVVDIDGAIAVVAPAQATAPQAT
ncbi:NfeD family protein [Actinomyces slackii]|uniref:NfeD-like C-terminal, partner-binding n=1 Tax=Actinomyces slackii TaxID=52774 RepID=A0A3S4WHH9_9ACTO|nr:NfeD family protein [Actinomyces slackii]VEG75032.1 NfeD-like C-terminal, partner-binding [Actinomyces slackii]